MNAKNQIHYRLRITELAYLSILSSVIHNYSHWHGYTTLSQCLIHFTVILMAVTHNKILDREAISNTSYILECLIACLSISISILHMRQLMNRCMTWIFVINALRHIAIYGHYNTLPSFPVY